MIVGGQNSRSTFDMQNGQKVITKHKRDSTLGNQTQYEFQGRINHSIMQPGQYTQTNQKALIPTTSASLIIPVSALAGLNKNQLTNGVGAHSQP